MASITEHVIKLQELTQKNLDILQALNDSFFTNQNHLSVRVGEKQYAIPSFISLENKLNSLTANFENLVNAPESGEAFFDFNGNSRAIQVRSYTSTPNSIVLDPVSEFQIEQNDIFKDFLTPNPYIHINVTSLPNDTTQVVVKKVIPLSDELKNIFKSHLVNTVEDHEIQKTSKQYNYKDLYKILSLYKQDVDYIEYDTKVDLPIRKNIGSGIYVIESIEEDIVDENLDNIITLKFRTDVDDPTILSSLKYRLFDETIEKNLKVGDQLVTFEGNAKLEILEIRQNTNTIVVKVLHGEFLNLTESNTNNPSYIPSLSKIKFYSPIDFNEDKYVKIPLEEDEYIFISVAPLNSRMNVQASWGGGLMINTYILTNNNKDFKTYYDENVKNVGDILFEITSMMSNTLTKFSKEEFEEFTNYIPEINTKNLLVTRVNEHLNNSIAVQNIRSLYSQKVELQTQLNETRNEKQSIKDTLMNISFDDTTGQRVAYQEQLIELNAKENTISTAITKIVNDIAAAANNSEIPIENAKYRIRGFFDTSNIKWDEHIKGIRVQYRYKNVDLTQNQALTINEKFVFSDWNEMPSNDRKRLPVYSSGVYKSVISPKTDNINEPSFNQIDIPISQGETVDIRLKLIYDFGDPFVQTSSKWSTIENIGFPTEFLKDIKILDIISGNNNDIENNHFNNIIKNEGIPEHISDKIIDQDITYYHKPENIASGFYTAERRIIPLKDKLSELSNLITKIQDEINGTNTTSLKISLKNGSLSTTLIPFEKNIIYTEAYSDISKSASQYIGNYGYDDTTKYVKTVFYLSLLNDSDHIVKLYSMFPGHRQTALNNLKRSKFNLNDYCQTINDQNWAGIWFETPESFKPLDNRPTNGWPCDTNGNLNNKISIQSCNQFLYFRLNNIYTDEKYYLMYDGRNPSENNPPEAEVQAIAESPETSETTQTGITLTDVWSADKNNCLCSGGNFYSTTVKNESLWNYIKSDSLNKPADTAAGAYMYMYPQLTSPNGLCINSDSIGSWLEVKPNDEIMIPIVVEYKIVKNDANNSSAQVIQKTMSFDIWTSLYNDPINYTFTVIAKHDNTIQDQLMTSQQAAYSTNTKYNIIYK